MGVEGGAPRGEGPALGLGDELRGVRADLAVPLLRLADACPVPARVETQRVVIVGVEIGAVLLGVREAPAHAVVVVEQRHGDPGGAHVIGQRAQERRAFRILADQLVLHLVHEHAAAAVGHLMGGDDLVDRAQPGAGVREVLRIRRAQAGRPVGHVGGQAAHRDLGVHIGAGAGDDVEPLLRRHGQQQVHVLDPAEVELPVGRGLVQPPEEVEGDRREAGRLEDLQQVTPLRRGRHSPGMDLAGVEEQALVVHQEGVLVPGDRVRPPVVAGEARGAAQKIGGGGPRVDRGGHARGGRPARGGRGEGRGPGREGRTRCGAGHRGTRGAGPQSQEPLPAQSGQGRAHWGHAGTPRRAVGTRTLADR